MRATCIKCGAAKKEPWHKCRECSFTPDEEDLVKSVYCSVGRFTDDPDEESMYESEILRLGTIIREGRPVIYDEAELERLRNQQRAVDSCSMSAAAILFRIFLPAILFLGVLWSLILILKK